MKYLILFSLKNKANKFQNVACCCHDWYFKDILIVLGFNKTSTLTDHFVSSPKEREKRDRRDSRGKRKKRQY